LLWIVIALLWTAIVASLPIFAVVVAIIVVSATVIINRPCYNWLELNFSEVNVLI
jgi:hypothetical protein